MMSPQAEETWRAQLSNLLMQWASHADDVADIASRRLRRRWGRSGIPQIQAYTGYRSDIGTHVSGRVLNNPVGSPDFTSNDWWDNLVDSYQRFASDEVPNVELEVIFNGQVIRCESDEEGYFHAVVPDAGKNDPRPFWSKALIRIVEHADVDPDSSTTIARVLTPLSTAEFMVISDVDDTIMHTGATELLTMAKLTFFANAKARLPLPGVADLYQRLQQGGERSQKLRNPIFYVSSSPWNLFDLLEDFLEINGLPDGPILLRDLGIDKDKFLASGHDHKLEKVRALMRDYPSLPVVLFGDSGQEDARLYALAAAEFGERIRAIFIRDVDPGIATLFDNNVEPFIRHAAAAGVPMYRIESSDEASERLKALRLLPE
ncbi:phosphatidate phosphatase APP1 [Rhodopirellula rubra]|uniref:Phosphatidate phosphatase APP1 n=1 Tax=Aporhodopirellula rubra TaxID=980271 RepID=A0A7W5E2W0_9BACT|nr:phosphatase domain-containing protein [Aporhodopirellula rubra]MBB3209191.1 phosphatidate phosphatase APP1 [Aporhodopirellula rubra]